MRVIGISAVFRAVLLCLLGTLADACLAQKVRLDEQVFNFDAGPVGYSARKLYVDGQFIDFAYTGFEVSRFSRRYLAYLSCSKEEPEEFYPPSTYGGTCSEWKLYDLRRKTGVILNLPDASHFWSALSFRYPLMAYVGERRARNSETSRLYCMVYDWRARSVIARRFMTTSNLATDVPLNTPQPVFSPDGVRVRCKFEERTFAVALK